MKQALRLVLRIPSWVATGQVSASVNRSPRGITWSGRYARIGAVNPGDVVTVTFPFSERTETIPIGSGTYTLTIRGVDVVRIEPQGIYYPFYQKEHYRSGTTAWRTVERYVPE